MQFTEGKNHLAQLTANLTALHTNKPNKVKPYYPKGAFMHPVVSIRTIYFFLWRRGGAGRGGARRGEARRGVAVDLMI